MRISRPFLVFSWFWVQPSSTRFRLRLRWRTPSLPEPLGNGEVHPGQAAAKLCLEEKACATGRRPSQENLSLNSWHRRAVNLRPRPDRSSFSMRSSQYKGPAMSSLEMCDSFTNSSSYAVPAYPGLWAVSGQVLEGRLAGRLCC